MEEGEGGGSNPKDNIVWNRGGQGTLNMNDVWIKGWAIWSYRWLHLISYLQPLAPYKKLYGATHFFNIVAPFSRLFGAKQKLGGAY